MNSARLGKVVTCTGILATAGLVFDGVAAAAPAPAERPSGVEQLQALLRKGLPPGPKLAERLESRTTRLGVRRVQDIRSAAAADLNKMFVDKFGPLPAATSREMGTSSYLTESDIEVYVVSVGGPGGLHLRAQVRDCDRHGRGHPSG